MVSLSKIKPRYLQPKDLHINFTNLRLIIHFKKINSYSIIVKGLLRILVFWGVELSQQAKIIKEKWLIEQETPLRQKAFHKGDRCYLAPVGILCLPFTYFTFIQNFFSIFFISHQGRSLSIFGHPQTFENVLIYVISFPFSHGWSILRPINTLPHIIYIYSTAYEKKEYATNLNANFTPHSGVMSSWPPHWTFFGYAELWLLSVWLHKVDRETFESV